MQFHGRNLLAVLVFSLSVSVLLDGRDGNAAESSARLIVRESGVNLYPRQDINSQPITTLEKDAKLIPMMEAVGGITWYMVQTTNGLVGWVRSTDVTGQTSFKEVAKEERPNIWSASAPGGKEFSGTWTLSPESTANKATGTWTLSGDGGRPSLTGGWAAEKFSTGWNGSWRASIGEQKTGFGGSWSAAMPHPMEMKISDLFEAAAKDIVRGLWTAGGRSGAWVIKVTK